jgi:hypothetical protein
MMDAPLLDRRSTQRPVRTSAYLGRVRTLSQRCFEPSDDWPTPALERLAAEQRSVGQQAPARTPEFGCSYLSSHQVHGGTNGGDVRGPLQCAILALADGRLVINVVSSASRAFPPFPRFPTYRCSSSQSRRPSSRRTASAFNARRPHSTNFVTAADGHGGTLITEAAQTANQ